jgi:hypothetical protein
LRGNDDEELRFPEPVPQRLAQRSRVVLGTALEIGQLAGRICEYDAEGDLARVRKSGTPSGCPT